MAQREIPLGRKDGSVSGYALVDDEDFERLNEFKWYLDKDGYARRNQFVEGKYKTIMMHRDIMGCVAGDGSIVDHANGNPLNNCKFNLRVGTQAQNCANRRPRRDCSSRYKGVSFNKGRWIAYIKINGKTKHLEYLILKRKLL